MSYVLLTPTEALSRASGFGLPLAHMCYCLGKGTHLYRKPSPYIPRGGLMLIGEDGFAEGEGDGGMFCREVLRECQGRGFSGVILDLESSPTKGLARILSLLNDQLPRRGLSFYVPEAYVEYASKAKLMLSSAISGGSLEHRLNSSIARYGRERLALCVERSCEDFQLPAPKGAGEALSWEQLQQLRQSLEPCVFFSQELCTHYFTYMNRAGLAHFVLFDDAQSVRNKLHLAQDLGIRDYFFYFPEVEGILPQLFPKH